LADDSAPSVRYRAPRGIAGVAAQTALFALVAIGLIWAAALPSYLGVAPFTEQYLAAFLGLALVGTFLLVPARRRAAADGVPWYDAVLALAAVATAGYVVVLYPRLAYSLSAITTDRIVVAAVGLFLILEATRRLFGWSLVVIALVFCVYAGLAHLFPGLLAGRGASTERILTYTYFDTNGLYGIALAVCATTVITFIFFAACLSVAGGEQFFTDIAMALMGRRRGGAAKISIVSSVLFGTVSGSAVANVVVGGSITIGMMKRNGYPPHVAGAIEAVSSTGGQIMPPVMGITAFLIAENLNMPYGEVALAALVPALLYYISLYVQADLEAAKRGLRGTPASELPRARDVMRRGWVFLVPLGLLVYMLVFASYRADFAGLMAAAATLLVPLIYSRAHARPRALAEIVTRTGRGMLDITAVCALAGIIMGALNLSGVLFKMTLILSSISFGHPIILLAIVAAICIVLGMGLPSIVIYVLLAVLMAPALTQLGVAPLAAHLFIFYFGMLSMITPPVALATFAAMSIAGSRLWPTGWAGMKLGIVAYIVPFIFALQPTLLLQGHWVDVTLAILTAVIGVLALSAGCAGFLFRRLAIWERGGFFIAGLALVPAPTDWTLTALNAAGGALGLGLALFARAGRAPAALASAPPTAARS